MRRPPRAYGRLTPELLLRAYATGIFPMAEERQDPTVFWVDPPVRGILPLDAFHVPRRLARTVRRGVFDVSCDAAFERVIRACAEATPRRRDTWINDEIIGAYVELHRLGFAHSVECWRGGRLAGGAYGVSLGAAFFGESMFSRATDAGKVALVHLVARLKMGGYVLLDTQFVTDHLRQFGAVEIPSSKYLQRLAGAISATATFYGDAPAGDVEEALMGVSQSRTQTS